MDFDKPILIAEGAMARVYVVGMFEQGNVAWHGEDVVPKCIKLKVENKIDEEIQFGLRGHYYINDENVSVAIETGSSQVPAGRTNNVVWSVLKIGSGTNYDPIGKFEDLYNLEGTFEIAKFGDRYVTGANDPGTETVSFDLRSLK